MAPELTLWGRFIFHNFLTTFLYALVYAKNDVDVEGKTSVMFILAGVTCIVFGVSQIWLKNLWWYDAALLGAVLGIRVERTAQWDRHRDQVGYVCASLGMILLVLHLVMV